MESSRRSYSRLIPVEWPPPEERRINVKAHERSRAPTRCPSAREHVRKPPAADRPKRSRG